MILSSEQIPVRELMAAARRDEVIAAMRRFYADAGMLIERQAPVCWNKGDCCRFGSFGHRLYVTALEVIYYLAGGEVQPAATDDTCPHAIDGRCHARERRPLACRIFYCDPNAQHWQGPLTERLLDRLRGLHDQLGVPYFYADWMVVLRALDETREADETRTPPAVR